MADGLPEAFRLTTRELLHLADIPHGSLPCCLVQMTPDDMVVTQKLGHVRDVRLPGRIIVGFAPATALPATVANAYRRTIDRMIDQDHTLGGRLDACYVTGELQTGIWAEVGLLAVGVLIEWVFEYDARLPAMA